MSMQGIGNETAYQLPRVWQQKEEQVEKAKSAEKEQVRASVKEADSMRGPASSQESAPSQALDSMQAPTPSQEPAPPQTPKLAERPRYDRYEPERKAQICTIDTGKVDREIEKLREEETRLSEQVRMTDDPQKKEELQRQLAQVEQELAQKDNDTYRRQHATVTGA